MKGEQMEMKILWVSVMTPQKLEDIRMACYRWAILNSRLKGSNFYQKTPVNHFKHVGGK
jgi:hypothetical protein